MSFVKKLVNLILVASFIISLVPNRDNPEPIIPKKREEVRQQKSFTSETPPKYPYGEERLLLFIKNQLKWPVREFCGEGTVVIGFTVDKKGNPSDYKIRRGFQEKFDQEALRVVKMIKKWKPGLNHAGMPIATQMNLPIRFRLD